MEYKSIKELMDNKKPGDILEITVTTKKKILVRENCISILKEELLKIEEETGSRNGLET